MKLFASIANVCVNYELTVFRRTQNKKKAFDFVHFICLTLTFGCKLQVTVRFNDSIASDFYNGERDDAQPTKKGMSVADD